jgi:hypothetical protein
VLEVLELEEMQELRVEIQFFLLLLLREVVAVLEILVAGFLPLGVQVAEVRLVEQLVLMAHLDRVVRVETALAGLVHKVVEEAVELVLLVRMEHLAYQVTGALV